MSVARPADDNVAMVAFHGDKTKHPDLTNIITATIQKTRATVRELELPDEVFKSYTVSQIHATIIGMEVIRLGDQLYNANYLNNNGQLRAVEPRRFLALLDTIKKARKQNPLFTIRFCGFRKSYCGCRGFDLLDWKCTSSDSEFHSFQRSAYEGSFYAFRGGPVMLTGWPVGSHEKPSEFNRYIYGFRRAAGACGFLDKYHFDEKAHFRDDDFYIRLGTLGQCSTPKFDSLVERVRDFLCLRRPTTLNVELQDLLIVYYEEPSLEKIKAKINALDAINDPQVVDDLYNRWRTEH